MAETAGNFLRALVLKLVKRAYDVALPRIPSQTLRKSLSRLLISDTDAKLYIPEYWAIYLHDTTNRTVRTGIPFVWFRDPKNDPRLIAGITPARFADFRSLTPAEFKHWAAINRQLASEGVPPSEWPMVVTRTKRRRAGTPFFENDPGGGMSSFPAEARATMAADFSDYVKRTMGKDLNVTGTIVVRL